MLGIYRNTHVRNSLEKRSLNLTKIPIALPFDDVKYVEKINNQNCFLLLRTKIATLL